MTPVFRQRFRGELVLAATEVEEIGIGGDEPLRQRGGLRQEEPVEVGEREGHVGATERLAGGDDVEHGELLHPLGVIESQTIGHAAAAVVAGHHEALEAELRHDGDLVAAPSPAWNRARDPAWSRASSCRRSRGDPAPPP